MARVVHFEVPAGTDASRKFYETVFGWKFFKYEGETEYWLITTGEDPTPGINGGLGGAANDIQGTVNTVGVDDIDETLKMVEANGGKVIMPKGLIPDIGYLAYVQEPDGVTFGVIQNLPGRSM
jgi:predicted enzyme related to lactoylglutathione lyase